MKISNEIMPVSVARAVPPAAPKTPASSNTAEEARQADFTNMTAQQLRGWLNEQIMSGKLSLDGTEGLATLSIEQSAWMYGHATSEDPRIDYFTKVRDGIAASAADGDETTRNMLEKTLDLMQKNQGKTIGIDIQA